MDETGGSWNQIASWLKRLDQFKHPSLDRH
jgi:hypothetical protein